MMERLPDGEAAEYGTALEEEESARTVADEAESQRHK